MTRTPYIVVAGSIGAGKSALAAAVADELGLRPVTADESANPYLPRFYDDMTGWAYRSQLWFLMNSVQQHRRIMRREAGVVQERSLYENFNVFAHELRDRQHITEEDFDVLAGMYYGVEDLLDRPDLLVLVDVAPDLSAFRLRAQGVTADIDYLQRLSRRYRQFGDSWLLSPVVSLSAEDSLEHNADRTVQEITARILG